MKKRFLGIGLPLLACLALASCGSGEEPQEYEITWEDYDGSVLRVDSLAYGDTPSYGEEPVREGDAQCSYAFSDWEPSVERVTGDATYKAVYTSSTNQYEITWEDYDGSVLRVDSLAYGDTPSYGEEPVREGDAQCSYAFSDWEPSVERVTGDATYKAVYTSSTNQYEITWEDYDGSVLRVDSVPYGETPSYDFGAPVRDDYAGPYDCWAFDGWYPEVEAATSDATYTATYSKQACTEFTIRYDANGGTDWVPGSQKKKSGEPLKLDTCNDWCRKEGYALYGWNNLYEGKIYHDGDELTLDMNLTMYAMWISTICTECEGEGYFCPYCNEPLIKKYESSGAYTYGYCSSCGKRVYKYGEDAYSSKVFFDEKVMCTNCQGKGYLEFDGDYGKCVFEDAPTVSENGARSITLNEKSGYEYSIDGGEYQSSNVFDGLLPHTAYTFRQRRATSGGVPFGVDSKELTVTTTNASSYYVTYELNGGTNNSSNPATYQRSATSTPLYSPTKEGYVFAGWSYNGEIVSEIKGSWNVDITLEATWKALDERQFGIVPFVDSWNETLTYGLYPQTRVSDEDLIKSLNTLTIAENNGWYLLDGEYYAKASASPYYSDYVFDDGTKIVKGTTYWFKCEPITWKILSSTDEGEYSLVSTVLLDAHRYNAYWKNTDSDGYYANNYEQSEIRAWLNKDFYNSAFALEDSYIQTTTVDNSASTTCESPNSYACSDTTDKVYLLSYQDYENASYFADYKARECKTTDWARANGAWYRKNDFSLTYNGFCWTRSPSSSVSSSAYCVSYNGSLTSYFGSQIFVDDSLASVRPGLRIKVA